MRTFTPKEVRYILDHTKGLKDKELAAMFNLHFGTNFNVRKFQMYKTRNKISNGLPRGWSKEFPPDNTGREPVNKRAIGSERPNSSAGYTYVKVAEPDIWITKQVYLWERYHKKKVPKGYVVIFLDNDKDNFNIENLALITRGENLQLNSLNLRISNQALTESAINLVRLENRIREVQ